MFATTGDNFIVNVSLGDEGSYDFAGMPSEGPLDGTFSVPGHVFVGLGMFNEDREGFSWDEDAEDAATICEIALRKHGYHVVNPEDFERTIMKLSVPGPGYAPGSLYVELVPVESC